MKLKRKSIWMLGSLLFSGVLCLAGQKLNPRLESYIAVSPPNGQYLVWIAFSDKGVHELAKSSVPLTVVSEASLRRRLNVRPPEALVDFSDLPVDPSYVAQIQELSVHVRQTSKWFNAVSAFATAPQLDLIQRLPFVLSIDLVTRYKKSGTPVPPSLPDVHTGIQTTLTGQHVEGLDYGLSFGQLNLIDVPTMHAMGNHAEGVIIGMFDNGFRLLSHAAFDTLRPRIIAMHDFVDHKNSVVPLDPNPKFGGHGVNTLSTIGGYYPGEVIGPAYGASFILARTENDSSETPIEEDNWVAGIEWMDSLGVQVTSTSLGYLTFDSPYVSLTWRDMDGKTAIISRAATMAAEKGIVVCNSAGNEHHGFNQNTLIAPADADSILTVGAVDPSGFISSFSSQGPTVDGRIKPDVMAQGSSVRIASATDSFGFEYSAGTSFSCPLAAGAAALLVKANPHATPMQIISALKYTANNASSPNNLYGWGIIDVVAAYLALLPDAPDPRTYALLQNYPNPFNPSTHIEFNIPEAATVSLKIYDILGRQVKNLVDENRSARLYTETWTGVTDAGNRAASGVYFYVLDATAISGGTHRLTGKMLLIK